MFEKELSYIKDEAVKKIAEEGVALLPDYFYHVPASSTGKYHPTYALGDGGLYRHVQAAVAIAVMTFPLYNFLSTEQDLIIASLILHDGWKQGIADKTDPGTSVFEHPVLAAKVLKDKIKTNSDEEKMMLDYICDNISSHMGQWNINKYSTETLPKPESEMQKYVHLCDYLASRKPLEFNFATQERGL